MTTSLVARARVSALAISAALQLLASCGEPPICHTIQYFSPVELRFTSAASLDGASVKVCATNARYPTSICAAGVVRGAPTGEQGFLAITGAEAADGDVPDLDMRLETRDGAAPASTLEITWGWGSVLGLRDGDLFRVDIVAADGESLFSGERSVNYDKVLPEGPDCGGFVRGEIVLAP